MDKNKINDLNSLLTEAEVDAKLNSLLKSLEEELEAEGTEDREPEEVDAAKVDIEPVGTEDEKKAEDISAEVNEAAVSEEVLEPNASTVDAVAQGVAGDGIASPVVGSNIENEDETKIDTETEVKPDGTIEVEVEVKPEDEEVVDTTEVEKRAIDIDPLKVVEEELSSIFAILKGQTLTESEGEEAVKDGEQDIEDAAKKDVDVVEFKNEKDTADDENDSEGQAHEIKVDSDATEDKKEPESDGEKVADELADELEAGMVKEELEAEGTEDREPKEATAAQMEVEPVGTEDEKKAEDVSIEENATLDEILDFLNEQETYEDFEYVIENILNEEEVATVLNEFVPLNMLRPVRAIRDSKVGNWTRRMFDGTNTAISKYVKNQKAADTFDRRKDAADIKAKNKELKKEEKEYKKQDAAYNRDYKKGLKKFMKEKYKKQDDGTGKKVRPTFSDDEVKKFKTTYDNDFKTNHATEAAALETKKAALKTKQENNKNLKTAYNDKYSDKAYKEKMDMLKKQSDDKYKEKKEAQYKARVEKSKQALKDKGLDVSQLGESLTDFEILTWLNESGYEPSLENLFIIKEELEAEGTEDREPKEATAAQMEVEPVGTDEGEEAEDIDETVNEEYIDNVLEEALKDIIEDATKRGKAKKRIRTAFRANADKYDLIKKQGLLSDEGMNAYESLTDEEKKEYHKFSNSGIKELKKVYDKKKNIELSKIKADRSRKKLESLKEAFEAGSAYYSTPERVQELQEMIAVSLAKENNDILFQEMSKCTQLAESFKNRLLHKYSIISENRTAEFLQSILESEACMDAVKDEMPEEVDADKLNVSPVGSEDEKKAEDIDVESLEESLTDFELLQVLDESGYEPSLENLSILKEYLLNEGKLKKALTAAAIGTGLVLGGASSTPDIKHNIEEVQNDKAELEKQTKEAEQKFNLSGAKQQLESEKINQEHVKNKTANLTGNEKLVGEDGNVYSLASKTEAENRVKEAQANLDKTNANISSYTASAKNDLEDSHKGLAKSIGHGAAKSLGGAGLAAAGAAAAKIADKIEEKKKAKRELGKKNSKRY